MLILPEYAAQQKAICKLLIKRLRDFYNDPQNRKEFEEWYLKEYGDPYVCKSVSNV